MIGARPVFEPAGAFGCACTAETRVVTPSTWCGGAGASCAPHLSRSLDAAISELKKLRGTRLDVFGYSEERRMERRLIGEYQATIDEVLATLGQDNHPLAVQIAALPESMRGFGHIKEKNVKAAKEREASLLAAYRNPATQSVAAE